MNVKWCFVVLIMCFCKLVPAHIDCSECRTRSYIFNVELYTTMGPACMGCPEDVATCFRRGCVPADGVARSIVTVNRTMPGPTIEVCEGDTVQVHVINNVPATSISVHYHGQTQKRTQYEDGVPYVTQCPISEHSSWTYVFVAQESGTFFWHSHSAFQKMEGMFGSFIVHKIKDPSAEFYDKDRHHRLVLQDWMHAPMVTYYPGAVYPSERGQTPDNILINGLGSYKEPSTGVRNNMPLSVLRMDEGVTYRVRITNAGCLECPLKLKIEAHSMTALATDGGPVEPVQFQTLVLLPGERYDVAVKADQKPAVYFIVVTAGADCLEKDLQQRAMICYSGVPCQNPPEAWKPLNLDDGIVLNPLAAKCGPGDSGVCVYQLRALQPAHDRDLVLHAKHTRKFTLAYNFHNYKYDDIFEDTTHKPFYISDSQFQAGQINNISMKMAPSPLLSDPCILQFMLHDDSYRCSDDTEQHQNCFHMLSVRLGDVVDIVYHHDSTDEKDETHPMHLHGNRFYVLYQGYSVKQALSNHFLNYNPPLKDTIAVPGSGYARIRFVANNAGFWLLHCHIAHHLETGMALVLKVGERCDLPPVPRGFPKCGNYYNHGSEMYPHCKD